jgi:WD40 repeat protein
MNQAIVEQAPRLPYGGRWRTFGLILWAAGVALGARALAAPVTALVFSPDGSALVSNGPRCLEVRSPRDGAVQRTIACEWPRITSLAFHSDGSMLAAAGGSPGESGGISVLEWKSSRVVARLTNFTDVVTALAFSPDGRSLAVASADASARIYSLTLQGAAEAFSLRGHSGPVLAAAWSPGGRSVVTAGMDRSVKVWGAADGKLIRSFNHHTEAVRALAFRPGVNRGADAASAECATGGDDRTVRIWQPELGRMVRIIRGPVEPVLAIAYRPDGTALFSAGQEGIVRRLDADSDLILGQWLAHDDWIYALTVSPDGSTLATGSWQGEVRLWDAKKDGVRR